MPGHCAGDTNAAALGWLQKCRWIGLVADMRMEWAGAEMQLDWDVTRTTARLGCYQNYCWIWVAPELQMVLCWYQNSGWIGLGAEMELN